MARVYATEDGTGRRFLLRIECDALHGNGDRCPATIKPHPEIAQSGWWRYGQREGSEIFEWYYCPDHAHIARGASGQ